MVVVAIAYTMLVLVRPWGGLMRLFGLYPAVRAALTGIGAASVLAGLVDGVGFTTAGAAAAVVLPLVTLAALRVLDHADDRTLADFVATDPDALTSSGVARTSRSPSAGQKAAVGSAVGVTSTDDPTSPARAGDSEPAPDDGPQPGPTSAAQAAAQAAAAGKPPAG